MTIEEEKLQKMSQKNYEFSHKDSSGNPLQPPDNEKEIRPATKEERLYTQREKSAAHKVEAIVRRSDPMQALLHRLDYVQKHINSIENDSKHRGIKADDRLNRLEIEREALKRGIQKVFEDNGRKQIEDINRLAKIFPDRLDAKQVAKDQIPFCLKALDRSVPSEGAVLQIVNGQATWVVQEKIIRPKIPFECWIASDGLHVRAGVASFMDTTTSISNYNLGYSYALGTESDEFAGVSVEHTVYSPFALPDSGYNILWLYWKLRTEYEDGTIFPAYGASDVQLKSQYASTTQVDSASNANTLWTQDSVPDKPIDGNIECWLPICVFGKTSVRQCRSGDQIIPYNQCGIASLNATTPIRFQHPDGGEWQMTWGLGGQLTSIAFVAP